MLRKIEIFICSFVTLATLAMWIALDCAAPAWRDWTRHFGSTNLSLNTSKYEASPYFGSTVVLRISFGLSHVFWLNANSDGARFRGEKVSAALGFGQSFRVDGKRNLKLHEWNKWGFHVAFGPPSSLVPAFSVPYGASADEMTRAQNILGRLPDEEESNYLDATQKFHWRVRVPFWAIIAAFGAYPLTIYVRRRLVRRRRARMHLCEKCGYSLTGNTSGVCPECGIKLVEVPSGGTSQIEGEKAASGELTTRESGVQDAPKP